MKKTAVQKNKRLLDLITSTLIVMELFFKYPSLSFSLSEVAKKTGLSKATVSKVINNLHKAKIVNIEDLRVVYRIRAANENQEYRREKIIRNIAAVVRSNIAEFLAQEYKNPRCIVLFGSFRRGEDDEGSDVDIAVEVSGKKEPETLEFDEFKSVEEELNRKISVHVFNREKIDRNVFMNIANGVVLQGLLEVSK